MSSSAAVPIDPVDKVPDHLLCPICIEIPKNNVFQCRKGHTICDQCYSKVVTCPQCRLRFGNRPIRNLYVEHRLDELNLDCPFKDSGCIKKVDRKTLQKHSQLCSYNISKFGSFIKVCKTIGYLNCDFEMNGGNAVESISHFESAHQALVVDADCYKLEIQNFFERPGGTRSCLILNRKLEGYAFLSFLTLTDGEYKSVIWDSFFWRYPRVNQSAESKSSTIPFQVKYSLKGLLQSLALSVTPTDILQSGDQGGSVLSTGSTMPAFLFVDETSKTLTAVIKIKRIANS